MSEPATSAQTGLTLLSLGLLLLAGFVAHVAGQRAHVPRVTLLLIVGAVAGPSGLDLFPGPVMQWFPLVVQMALSMVGFSLGRHFTGRQLRHVGKVAVASSLLGAVLPAILVSLVVWLVFGDLLLGLLLAGVAAATDPAATVDVMRETRSRGPLTDATQSVVALDDAWAVILFSLLLVAAELVGGRGGGLAPLGHGLFEILGGAGLGLALGLPMAFLSGRIKDRELTLVETLGFVLVAGGAASFIGVSFLITSMTMGLVVANLAKHHRAAFHAVEGATEPFVIVFFLLSGMSFQLEAVLALGAIGVAYLLARSAGKVVGGWLGARITGAHATVTQNIGLCLLPQAGVALGMGLVLAERFPERGGALVSLLVASTTTFELVGPLFTRFALGRAGEIPDSGA